MSAVARLGAIVGMFFVSMGSAHAQGDGCARIDDPAARLACYDQRSGRAPVAPAPAAAPAQAGAVPAAPAARAAPPAEDEREALRRRTDFDTSLTAVKPLRHGYYRLELADGTAYNTTVVAAPPKVGEAVHVRRSPLGTTFFDMAGRKPFVVKLARQR